MRARAPDAAHAARHAAIGSALHRLAQLLQEGRGESIEELSGRAELTAIFDEGMRRGPNVGAARLGRPERGEMTCNAIWRSSVLISALMYIAPSTALGVETTLPRATHPRERTELEVQDEPSGARRLA